MSSASPRPEARTLTGADDTVLRTLVWEPSREEALSGGRVILVHGLGEHAGRYRELSDVLSSRGFAVLSYDQRGHGESKGRRGVLPDFDLLLEDLHRIRIAATRELSGEGEPFLVGHSLGALVVLRYLQTRRPAVPGAVLVAPWLGTALPIPAWKRMARPFLLRVAPDFALPNPMDPEHLTRDPEMQRRWEEDALVHSRISARLFSEVEAAQARALETAPPADVPLLFLIPGHDPLVDGSLSEGYAGALSGDVTVERLQGMRHEPFQEVERADVFERVGEWMRKRSHA